MVSERRRARMQPAAEPVEGIPEWVWGREFRTRRWLLDHGGSAEGRYEAVKEWEVKRDAWLRERGLVMYGMAGLGYEEFRRICREEPHRVIGHRPGA